MWFGLIWVNKRKPFWRRGHRLARIEHLGFAGRDGTVTMKRQLIVLLLLFLFLSVGSASEGDRHPHFRSCTESCEKMGKVNKVQLDTCVPHVDGTNVDYEKPPKVSLLQVLQDWDCKSECRYHCMKDTESKRQAVSEAPMKYFGKWPFTRYMNLQEPASVLFSALNLMGHLQGLLSYWHLVYTKLPQRTLAVGGKAPYYEFSAMWIIYGLFSVNSWIWSAFFHARDVEVTERLDYSSAVALLGYTLILTIIRTGSLRAEAAQVMVAAPIIAFISTHIMYLNFYNFDYGLNMKVCVTIGVAQLLLWTGWAAIINHPSRFKLWGVVLGTVFAMLLEIFDFPPFWGFLDAHALWHACTIPITVLWWNFIRDDVSLRTYSLQNRVESDVRKVQ